MILRCARGFAPLSISVVEELPAILAVGAHLKNSVALSVGAEIFMSQHIGDLETGEAHAAFECAVEGLPRLYETTPAVIAHDLHPDYLSTRFAGRAEGTKLAVQHHWAHVLSCLADNAIAGPALGVAWDGTGLGADGTIWGGEFLRARGDSFERVAHLRTFRLPGGEAAAREPRRSALGLLFECGRLENAGLPLLREFPPENLALLRRMLERGIQSRSRPVRADCSTRSRRFSVCARSQASRGRPRWNSSFWPPPGSTRTIHSKPAANSPSSSIGNRWLRRFSTIWKTGVGTDIISAKFHNTLVEMIVHVAREAGERRVALSGGCFQNGVLLERAVRRLREENFKPVWHWNVPPNDGGISLGQIIAAARQLC